MTWRCPSFFGAGACTCTPTKANFSCCLANGAAPGPGGHGFATISLSRSGHAGREHDTGAQ